MNLSMEQLESCVHILLDGNQFTSMMSSSHKDWWLLTRLHRLHIRVSCSWDEIGVQNHVRGLDESLVIPRDVGTVWLLSFTEVNRLLLWLHRLNFFFLFLIFVNFLQRVLSLRGILSLDYTYRWIGGQDILLSSLIKSFWGSLSKWNSS